MAGRVMCPNDPPPSPTFVHVLGFFNSCLLFFYTFLLLVLLSPQGCLKEIGVCIFHLGLSWQQLPIGHRLFSEHGT